MKVPQAKIAQVHRVPPDVIVCQRKIESLEQENEWLKARLAQILRNK